MLAYYMLKGQKNNDDNNRLLYKYVYENLLDGNGNIET